MKGLFSEYGHLVLIAIVAMVVLAFMLSSGPDGFLGKLSKIKPVATTQSENNSDSLADEAAANLIEITIPEKRLAVGNSYDLLEGVTAATNSGIAYPVNITDVELIDFAGNVLGTVSTTSVGSGLDKKVYLDVTEKGLYKVGYKAGTTKESIVYIAD